MTKKKTKVPEQLTPGDYLKMTNFSARLWGARKREIGNTWVTASSYAYNLDIPEKTIRDAYRNGTLDNYAAEYGYDWGCVRVRLPQHGTSKGTAVQLAFDFVKKPEP